ncbi:hypermethylated in cancer 2 protein [Spea bombifrons]|uniref:hypermethylated in cancer 2 protein n=1 Tax=Spea bombifrons TaxID=233779 RepID=UPI0023497B4C|nr:hypermethylated in cancer 2 protein [Spea bombifrons]XP_053326816.1 hypermethylated in cancer 2 protein [Spea bombifrons]
MDLPNHAKQLLLQLNQQRAKGFLCDVIIVVENALFRAHKNILAASSMYFKSLVLHDNLINLDTDMVNPAVFRQILDFIYTGKLLPSEQPGEQNFNALLTAASYLQLHDLAALCRKKLKRGGKPFVGKLGVPSIGRVGRSHRLSAPQLSHMRFSGSVDDSKESHSNELSKVSGPEDEIFVGTSKQENNHPLKRGAGSNNSLNNSTNGSDQELGLDLSKKSPLPAQDEVAHSDSRAGSPQSASASVTNSASYEESALQNREMNEPMELEENHSEAGPKKNLRLTSRKKEWDRKEDEKSVEEGGTIPNGVIVGPLSKERNSGGVYGSDQTFHCKEEMENGKDNSEESGHSDNECNEHPNANYVYRQEGFETVPFGDNLYVCIPCGKGFPNSEQLNAHVETHTEEELYIKEEDSYSKDEAEDLSTPNTTFPNESRPFKCSVCERSYKDPATLRQHEKTHWLTRPFPCNICGKMFTQRGTMTRHMRSHLGLKPFACEECGMRFTRQYRLTEHMRVHSGEKPYECQLCGGKFTQQRNLISHLRMHTSPS